LNDELFFPVSYNNQRKIIDMIWHGKDNLMRTGGINHVPRLTMFILTLILLLGATFVLAYNITAALSSNTDVAFVDESDNKITGPILNENNMYPGWSRPYKIMIKNFGNKAKYRLRLVTDEGLQPLSLADVLSVKIDKDGTEKNYRLADSKDIFLIDETIINKGEKQEVTLTLAMDETAGNEYQNLSIGLDLVLNAGSVADDEHGNGNNEGGGGNNDTGTVVEPEPTPEDNFEEDVIIEDDNIPEGEPEPDTEKPAVEETEDQLPQTGGIPIELFIGMGIVFIVSGLLLNKKIQRKI